MFLHDWAEDGAKFNGTGIEGLKADFDIKDDALGGCRILLASYTYEDYGGDAFVLFERDGKLFEVNGGHCSCYGLEGQWEPEETTIEALMHRLNHGTIGITYDYETGERTRNVYASELRAVLHAYEKEAA